ncbi:hypothetical protein [Nonomuraea sp. NPDC049141]|uniref:hypothetical protein n=1 Tax=unclassified Nonomuraea TaxID=2593643 RepID=UPI0033D414C6
MIRILAAVLVLLTAACSADPAPARPMQASSTPQAGPGRYTRTPDPCSLLTAEGVERLVPLAEQRYDKTECTWSTPRHLAPANSHYTLTLVVHLATDVAAAGTYLKEQTESRPAFGRFYVKGKASAVSGVGDEAVTLETSRSTLLVYRLSNAVITIQYGRAVQDEALQADPRQRDNARKAALWVAQAMDRPAPAVNPSDGRFAAAPYACALLEDGVPVSATVCNDGGVIVQVRLAPPWQGKSGIAVAKEMMAHYRSKPFKPVKSLGDEAFLKKDIMWVRVSNLVLKVGNGTRADVARVLDRLPPP